jgi:hypothetical protein
MAANIKSNYLIAFIEYIIGILSSKPFTRQKPSSP